MNEAELERKIADIETKGVDGFGGVTGKWKAALEGARKSSGRKKRDAILRRAELEKRERERV